MAGGGNNNNMNNNVMVNCGTAFAPDNRGFSWGLIKADGSSWDMLLKMNNQKYQQVLYIEYFWVNIFDCSFF